MPSLTQAQGIVDGSSLYAGIFNPVIGGVFSNGQLKYDTQGDWWISTAATQNRPGIRPRLYYGSSSNAFGRDSFARYYGFYIRCVSEEKTVTDLTYMQDMTLDIGGFFIYRSRII